MLARGALPLCLLLLAWTFPTRVSCQNVTVKEVSTVYVEVTWTRHQLWLGVEDFDIGFRAEGSSVCNMTVRCTTITCTFNSIVCGFIFPCTPTNITISGGSYTAPTVSLVTGPKAVSAFETRLHIGVEYIRWDNPSTDSSPCYEKTAVRVYYDGEESISYFGYEEETMNKSLCVEGFGEVEVWTVGGDGHSNSSRATITYQGSDVVNLVKHENCEPMDCTGMEVKWLYSPVCTDVDHISVHIGGNIFNTSVSTTNLTVTDLTFDSGYEVYVSAMRKDGKELDTTSTKYCTTRYEVPKNLEVVTLNSSSLQVNWNPPLCPREPPAPYLLTMDSINKYTTNATTYDLGGLDSFEQYYIEVEVDRPEYYYIDKYKVQTLAKTAAPKPTLRIDSVQSDAVEVSWRANFDHYFIEVDYELTWGKDLQFEEETTEESFTILDFNSTDEVYKVCVATIPDGTADLMSQTDCKLISDFHEDDGLSGWAITGIVIGSVLLIGLLVGLFVVCKKNKNSENPRLLTQKKQYGIQQGVQ